MMKSQISVPVRKKDAFSLLLGKPVYTDDLTPKDALCVKLLRSPYAYAEVLSIDKSAALKVPGVVTVLTWEDVSHKRFTTAGQAVPEWSPIDHLVLDHTARFVGDPIAIVAAENEKAADAALKLIRVQYEVKEPVLDLRQALDNKILVHAEDDWTTIAPFNGDASRNLCAHEHAQIGDAEEKLKTCAHTFENTYLTHQVNQVCMETYRAYTWLDSFGRVNVISSTQIPFHVRRIVANALDIPASRVRVMKPRIGGGFGSKQTAVVEMYPAVVTYLTGRPAKIIYSRKEFFFAGNPRHEMEIHVKIGTDDEGHILAADHRVLSNTGAYGEHGPTTISLSGRQPLSIYRHAKDMTFDGTVVYTNTVPAGAYRGFGVTQGAFAMESAVNELAHSLNIDPYKIREINLIREGDAMGIYDNGEVTNSCRLLSCLETAAEHFDWKNRSQRRVMPDGKIRAGGLAAAMQGSGIAHVDTATAVVRLVEDGSYVLEIGAADMGTGCDTILAQIAAEALNCDVNQVRTADVDTDHSPYDTGSYASSTTYVTGGAVVKACDKLKKQLIAQAAEMLSIPEDKLELTADKVGSDPDHAVSLKDLCFASQSGSGAMPQAAATNAQPISPPPFMVCMTEVEVDPDIGSVRVVKMTNAIDCGTVINTALARVQAEGAAMQALGMTLTEQVHVDEKGRMTRDSLMTYGLPTRLDCPDIEIVFCPSHEETGPFGAKSIGEVAINAVAPAITDAIWRATGVRVRELPVTPEKVLGL